MTQNWMVIYTTTSLPKAAIIKGMLEENGVPAMLVNNQSSSYLSLGEIEVHVARDFEETAKLLLGQNEADYR
jgi:hypothetical protein